MTPNPIQNNPPATAATISALVAAFMVELLNWLQTLVEIPQPLATTGSALLLGLMGFAMGKFAQRYTWPDWKIQQEFVNPTEADEHWSGDLDEPQVYGDV